MIQSVAPSGACAHVTGIDAEDAGITVQLFPFNNTPNNGGVYKVWVTPTADLNCDAPGQPALLRAAPQQDRQLQGP